MIENALQDEALQWETLQFKRGEYLISPGQIEKYIYFVKSGAIRAFILSENEEFTIRFAYTGSIITALPSYFNEKPTDLYIQAMRQSQVIRTTKTRFEEYFNQDLESQKAYQTLLKNLLEGVLEREIDLLNQSPANRLHRVLERSPKLFQEVPHKYIASYLRMTPETLSRLLNS